MHHDEHTGQFVGDGTSSLTKTEKSDTIKKQKYNKPALGQKQDLRGKRISRRELGTIKTDFFKNFNNVEARSGDVYICKTARYRYVIRLNEDGNLANFSPVCRWRIK